jgi:hypothetical protein
VSTTWVKLFFWSYLLFLVWADATAYNPADPDLWHRLTLGEALWKTGQFPPGDAFSYLADYKNIADHEWGSAIIFYALYHWGGPGAIVGMKLVALAITLALLVWAGLRQRAPSPLAAAFYALVLLALLPSFQSTVRCMVFTHVFFALWLFWFQCERHGRPVFTGWYVLTAIIWANLHGGFAIGLAWLAGICLIEFCHGGSWRKWLVRLGLCFLATLINPFGWRLWISTGRALLSARQGFDEWAPVSWWTHPGSYVGYELLLFGVVLALAFQIHRRGWAKVDRSIFTIIIAFTFLSMTSARHTSLFAAVAGALLPSLFPQEPSLDSFTNPIHRLAYMALRSTLLIIPLYSSMYILPGNGFQLRYPNVACPMSAVDYLKRQNIRGNLLVPFNYGSYAMWELRGQMRVSMDGRYDLVYSPETYRRVNDFFMGKGDWQTLLTKLAPDKPPPDAVLLPVGDAVYPKLRAQLAWKEAYRDSTDAIFLPRR